MDIRIYKNFNNEIEILWKELELNSSITPFQSYTWINHWYKTVGFPVYQVQPHIVGLYKGKELEALLPFGIRKIGPIKVLEWLGGLVTDYMIPIIKRESEFFNCNFLLVWEEIKKAIPEYDALLLSKQLTYIGLEKNPFSYNFNGRHMMNSYQSFFKVGWEEYKKIHLSTNILRDTRRRRRRLSEIGNLEFKIFQQEQDISNLLKVMFQQKSRRYDEKDGWDLFKLNEYKDFYEKMPKALNQDSSIHCSALLLDNKIIATHWGVTSSDSLFYLMMSHKGEDFAKYSAGRLLLENLLEWCSNSGRSYFDFTGGEESYKKVWSNHSVELTEVLEFESMKGRLYIYAHLLKSYLRRKPIIGRVLKTFYNLLRRK
mgnify:CR=1 FL=1